MLVLGISALDCDSTAVLFKDNELISAISEERLTRKKQQEGFPSRALDSILNYHKISPQDIDYVAYPFQHWSEQKKLLWKTFNKDLNETLKTNNSYFEKFNHEKSYLFWNIKAVADHKKFGLELEGNLKKRGLISKLFRVDHQTAHAASAFYSSGLKEALILTLDWYGDGLAGSVSVGGPSGIRRVHSFDYPHSLGLFYAQATGALGFRMNRHEGKIVGLAAHGNRENLASKVASLFDESDGDFRYKCSMNSNFFRKLAADYSREDVAAAAQYILEKVTTRMLSYYVKKENQDSVVFAGGVAANVKLNQRIFQIEGVKNIYIYPAMADAGTGAGAALYLLAEKGITPKRLESVFLGPSFSDNEIEAALKESGLVYKRCENIERNAAELLAKNKIIARFNGAMEYGPRALGNRSILYSAQDASVNDWLNKKLNRSEFMPFAPVTLAEDADRCYLNIKGAEFAACFMTITVDCTDWMKQNFPAAVHVDGTARPQLVTPQSNPSFYKLISEYKLITGFPTIINTSFNMHEDPIVCTPQEAIAAFKQSRLDALAIGNYLAYLPE